MFPILWQTQSFTLYAYPLFLGMAWGVAYNIALRLLEREQLSTRGLNLFFLGNFFFSWVGAKLFFLLVSAGEHLSIYASEANFWLGGGFVFYGGFLFALVYSFVYIFIWKRFSPRSIFVFFPALAFGHAFGRLGCFLAGCCYGRESDWPWSVHMHDAVRHPVQLYEAALLILLGVAMLVMIRRRWNGDLMLRLYIAFYAGIRLLTESFRGDGVRGVTPIGLSTSQVVSLVLLLVVLGVSGYEFLVRKMRRDY